MISFFKKISQPVFSTLRLLLARYPIFPRPYTISPKSGQKNLKIGLANNLTDHIIYLIMPMLFKNRLMLENMEREKI
jgi:hypothetical protein